MAKKPNVAEEPEAPSDAEVVAKCKELYKRVAELESEEDRFKELAKGCRKRADALLAEVKDLITKPDNQIKMGLAKPPEEEGEGK